MRRQTSSDDRGQTLPDFAIGVSLFMLALVFVLWFSVTLFAPFMSGVGASHAAVDRAADHVAKDLLVNSTAEPGQLAPSCTVALVTADDALANEHDCGFAASDSLDMLIGLDGSHVDITVHEPSANASEPASIDWDGSAVALTRATTDGEPDRAASASRVVTLDDELYRLTVRRW